MGAVMETPGARLQRETALEKANWIRGRRARVKRELKAGDVLFTELLADPPEWLASAKVYEVLLWVPQVGRQKACAALRAAGMSTVKTFGEVSDRQAGELLARLRLTPVVAARPAMTLPEQSNTLRCAPDNSFRFGGPVTVRAADCCGKPQGCTNPTEGCIYKGHPFKRHIYEERQP